MSSRSSGRIGLRIVTCDRTLSGCCRALHDYISSGALHVNVIGISGLDNSAAFKRRELPDLDEREYRIAQGFDSAAALVTDNDVAAAVAEERFTGEKSPGAFPRNAILYCLEAAKLKPVDIDHIAHGFAYTRMPFHRQGSLEQRRYDEVYAPQVTAGRAEDIF